MYQLHLLYTHLEKMGELNRMCSNPVDVILRPYLHSGDSQRAQVGAGLGYQPPSFNSKAHGGERFPNGRSAMQMQRVQAMETPEKTRNRQDDIFDGIDSPMDDMNGQFLFDESPEQSDESDDTRRAAAIGVTMLGGPTNTGVRKEGQLVRSCFVARFL